MLPESTVDAVNQQMVPKREPGGSKSGPVEILGRCIGPLKPQTVEGKAVRSAVPHRVPAARSFGVRAGSVGCKLIEIHRQARPDLIP
jgi:hypothetical protein